MADIVILAEQDLAFNSCEIEGLYLWMSVPSAVSLTEGEEYNVVWDGVTHKCKAIAANLNGTDGLGLGNFALAGVGENTEEPFLFGVAVDGSFSACYTTESDETNKMAIYQIVEVEEPETPPEDDNPEEEPPEGIVLKDRNGNDVKYYGIETVTFDTTTEGKQQTFTKGVKAEKSVPLDMSGGNQTIVPDDGTLLSGVTVEKPDTLTPENIRNGVEIGGVSGEFIGDTEEQTVALDMSGGDMVIEPSEAGKVLSKVTVQKPETLIPENIAEGVDIAGIIGTLSAGKATFTTGTFAGSDTAVQTVEHGLGVVPDIVIIINLNQTFAGTNGNRLEGFNISQALATKLNLTNWYGRYWAFLNKNNGYYVHYSSNQSLEGTTAINGIYGATESTFNIGTKVGTYCTLTWIAITGLV